MKAAPHKADDKTLKSKAYARIRRRFLLIELLLTASTLFIIQLSGASIKFNALLSSYYPNFYIKNILFVAVLSILMAILFFPLNYFVHFYLEHRFQLSTQSLKGWLKDGLKAFCLNLIFSIVLVETVYSLIRKFPTTWWIFSTFFYFFFTVVLSRITPTVILPLFYKVKPLQDSSLVERLKSLAHSVGLKVVGVFQMDMSRKTKKANAMFTGLGKSKRIILGDTLLNHFLPDEVEVVLAHELGHYYYKHLWHFIILSLGTSFAGFYLVHQILKKLVAPLGLQEIHDIAGLPIFMLTVFLFLLVLMPFQNTYSRRLEMQADRFALEKTKNPQAFIEAMKKLADQNLAEVSPHPWVEFILYSHPSIEKRIRFAQNYEDRSSQEI
jgi:STE24 endopeptidase